MPGSLGETAGRQGDYFAGRGRSRPLPVRFRRGLGRAFHWFGWQAEPVAHRGGIGPAVRSQRYHEPLGVSVFALGGFDRVLGLVDPDAPGFIEFAAQRAPRTLPLRRTVLNAQDEVGVHQPVTVGGPVPFEEGAVAQE